MPTRVTPGKWLSCPIGTVPAPLRLWCLPFAGGGAASWHPWAPRLAGTAEIVAVRLPGRENRLHEKPYHDAARLVEAIAAVIAPYAHEPYVLCGHSLGGLLAFEVARRLRAQFLPLPRGLIVSGVRAAHLPRREPDLRHLGDDAFVSQVDTRYGGIPPAIREDREFLALMLPTLRADITVYETYQYLPGEPLPTPVLALGGEADATTTRDELLAWQQHSSGPFESAFFPGGHFYLQPQIGPVTQRVAAFLKGL